MYRRVRPPSAPRGPLLLECTLSFFLKHTLNLYNIYQDCCLGLVLSSTCHYLIVFVTNEQSFGKDTYHVLISAHISLNDVMATFSCHFNKIISKNDHILAGPWIVRESYHCLWHRQLMGHGLKSLTRLHTPPRAEIILIISGPTDRHPT